MKSVLKIAAVLMILTVLALAGCNTDTILVTGITLDKTSDSINVGGVTLLSAVVEPVEATNTEVSWSSIDDAVAIVSDNGIVVGMAEGTATITATTDDGEFTASCEVTVNTVGTVGVTGVNINPESIDILASETHQLTVVINPANATDHSVSWESLNEEIAAIDEYGMLNAKQAGEAVISVTTADGGFTATSAAIVGWVPTTGNVDSHQKINDTEGGFTGTLNDDDYFGHSIISLGDLNGDDVADLVVGAYEDDDGGTSRGAVWVLFMNSDGTVSSHQKISDTEGGFTGILDNGDFFGSSVTSPGDINGDGVTDLVVGAYRDDDGGTDRGAVWVLFLNSDGTMTSHQKISDTAGGFTGTLSDEDLFGSSVTSPGDIDGDGVADLVVGAMLDDDGVFLSDKGAVWVLFLNSDGTVAAYQKISDTEGGFTGTLNDGDWFGSSVISIGDINEDGVTDLAVGAIHEVGGATMQGAVWLLFLNDDGTVASHQKISDTEGGFIGTLDSLDEFGSSVTSPGDINGDDVADLIVGARGDDDGGTDCQRGAVWVLFLDSDGTVSSHQKISDTAGGFTGILDDVDWFGCSVASPGDMNGDGIADLVVGANRDDDGGTNRGAVWVLFMEGK